MNTKARLTPEMEANKWWKGERSPNPSGRPRRAPISEAYAHHVGTPLPEAIRSRLRLPQGARWADAMALGQLHSAVKGNTVAAREIADRVEGRVLQPIGGEDGGPVQVKWVVEHIGRPEPKE
jgi:hypothetical protein